MGLGYNFQSKALLPTDFIFLNNLQSKLNWSILSENESIQRKFNYDNWDKDIKGWFNNVVKYLKQFKAKMGLENSIQKP